MITKKRALEVLHENIKNKNLRKHHYGVAAAMKGLALELGGDLEVWEIVGLLHDADYEKTKDQMERHTILLAEILAGEDVGEEIIAAIQSHASEYTGVIPSTAMEFALLSCDDLTGLIVAAALVHPEKLAGVTVDLVLRKFGSKSFAASVNRKKIQYCEKNLDISLDDFITIVLQAMQKESVLLGL
ncbi:MAG: HDIG domain-containing protein [Anaerolineales bacterium]|nr:MAG: HDIG domain-containing protein [Anaerolineales bacterium]